MSPATSNAKGSARGPLRLAVLASGGGTTLRNLRQRIAAGRLDARVVAAVCSNRKCYDTIAGNETDLRVELINRKDYGPPSEFSDVVFGVIRDAQADLVVLAGFLSLLDIPDDYAGRVINIHPALLPAFGGAGMYGRNVHAAVVEAGCKISGCTVHFADQTYDTGPIILQRACLVYDSDTPDTLAARVFAQECIAYPAAIQLIAEGRVHLDGRITRIDDAGLVRRAREMCIAAHGKQKRASGRPYWEHLAAVARLLRQQGVRDPHLLAAAFLHDTVEDTAVSLDDIRSAFGDRVATLVDEMTLPDRPGRTFDQKHAELAEHARAMSPDAKLLKLADRTHNLRELYHRNPARHRPYAEASRGLLDALEPWPARGEPLVAEIRRLIDVYAR